MSHFKKREADIGISGLATRKIRGEGEGDEGLTIKDERAALCYARGRPKTLKGRTAELERGLQLYYLVRDDLGFGVEIVGLTLSLLAYLFALGLFVF